MTMSNNTFFGPMTLQQNEDTESISKIIETQECVCVLCENKFTLPDNEKSMVTHLFMEHRFVIADISEVADLPAYLCHWKSRFKDENVPYFCSTMLLDEKPDGTKSKNEEYYLLSDDLPEDKELRTNLQKLHLEKMLKHHQFEREDKTYERECLFCRFTSKDTRANYLKHLFEKHNFHIAKPENLTFIDQLIETLSSKLENLQCIFCEKYFKDRVILKEHMRKKGHKRINPDNKEYDKFFLVNYLDRNKMQRPCKSSKTKTKSYTKSNDVREVSGQDYRNKGAESDVDSDPDWSEWTEENGPLITCLFCSKTETEFDHIIDHIERQHEFSFTEATKGMSFYHKIKIVNYIRRQIHLKQCLGCDLKFNDVRNLEKHLKESKHLVLEKVKWDQPEFYFSTYEDDLFLCYIQDEGESWWSGDEREGENSNQSDIISEEMAQTLLND